MPFRLLLIEGKLRSSGTQGPLGTQPGSSSPFLSITSQQEPPGQFFTKGGEGVGAPQRGPGVGPFSIGS